MFTYISALLFALSMILLANPLVSCLGSETIVILLLNYLFELGNLYIFITLLHFNTALLEHQCIK